MDPVVDTNRFYMKVIVVIFIMVTCTAPMMITSMSMLLRSLHKIPPGAMERLIPAKKETMSMGRPAGTSKSLMVIMRTIWLTVSCITHMTGTAIYMVR